MSTENIRIEDGFAPGDRPKVAELFWQAFKGKLGKVLRPETKALTFVERVLDSDFAISAYDQQKHLLGVAGFKTADGALVGGGLRDIIRHYGVFGGTWRGMLLNALERDTRSDELLMDGIFVDAEERGKGVGTKLLSAIKSKAQMLGKASVRLDVIDTNPRARALYERNGFDAHGIHTTGPLKHIFGFSSATTMIFDCRKGASI